MFLPKIENRPSGIQPNKEKERVPSFLGSLFSRLRDFERGPVSSHSVPQRKVDDTASLVALNISKGSPSTAPSGISLLFDKKKIEPPVATPSMSNLGLLLTITEDASRMARKNRQLGVLAKYRERPSSNCGDSPTSSSLAVNTFEPKYFREDSLISSVDSKVRNRRRRPLNGPVLSPFELQRKRELVKREAADGGIRWEGTQKKRSVRRRLLMSASLSLTCRCFVRSCN